MALLVVRRWRNLRLQALSASDEGEVFRLALRTLVAEPALVEKYRQLPFLAPIPSRFAGPCKCSRALASAAELSYGAKDTGFLGFRCGRPDSAVTAEVAG